MGRLSLPPGVSTTPLKDCRGLMLSEPNRRGTVRAPPIGLPCLPYSTDRGRFQAEGHDLVLSSARGSPLLAPPPLVVGPGPKS